MSQACTNNWEFNLSGLNGRSGLDAPATEGSCRTEGTRSGNSRKSKFWMYVHSRSSLWIQIPRNPLDGSRVQKQVAVSNAEQQWLKTRHGRVDLWDSWQLRGGGEMVFRPIKPSWEDPVLPSSWPSGACRCTLTIRKRLSDLKGGKLAWDTDFIGPGRNFPFPLILSVVDRPTVWDSNTLKLARDIREKFILVSSLQIARKHLGSLRQVFGGVEFRSRSQCFDDKQRDGPFAEPYGWAIHAAERVNKNIIFGRCVRFVNTHSRFGQRKG